MTIGAWIQQASKRLADEMIDSARLDAEIILAHTLNKSRTWLHAHSNDSLDERRRDIAEARIDLRLDRIPVAYIIGHKEFYGRRFIVSPEVLIPRPESEALIDLFLELSPTQPKNYQVVDVGTGSGCLGITIKLERPEAQVTLVDASRHALTVTRKNAKELAAKVNIIESNLLDSYPFRPDCVVANLPYVDPGWESLSPELQHEPVEALFADKKGLDLIYKLIDQAASRLSPGGLLILEADTRQLDDIVNYAQQNRFQLVKRLSFSLALRR